MTRPARNKSLPLFLYIFNIPYMCRKIQYDGESWKNFGLAEATNWRTAFYWSAAPSPSFLGRRHRVDPPPLPSWPSQAVNTATRSHALPLVALFFASCHSTLASGVLGKEEATRSIEIVGRRPQGSRPAGHLFLSRVSTACLASPLAAPSFHLPLPAGGKLAI